MYNLSVIGMFVYKEVNSNDSITSSSSINGIISDVVEKCGKIIDVVIFIFYNKEPLYETIGRVGTLSIIFIIFWDFLIFLPSFPFTTSETMRDYYLYSYL